MKRHTKSLAIIAFSLIYSGFIFSESFTKKKNKAPSANSLKADCGYKCGDILELTTHVQEELAQLQRELLKKSRELVEGENSSFFNKSSKSSLQVCLDKLNGLESKIEAFRKELQSTTNYIKGL
jgi:hypothetical protein